MRIDLQLFLNRWLCDDKTGKKFIPWSLFFAKFAVRNMNFAIWKTHKLPMDNLRLFWLLQQKSKDFNKNVLPILKLPYLLYCL